MALSRGCIDFYNEYLKDHSIWNKTFNHDNEDSIVKLRSERRNKTECIKCNKFFDIRFCICPLCVGSGMMGPRGKNYGLAIKNKLKQIWGNR